MSEEPNSRRAEIQRYDQQLSGRLTVSLLMCVFGAGFLTFGLYGIYTTLQKNVLSLPIEDIFILFWALWCTLGGLLGIFIAPKIATEGSWLELNQDSLTVPGLFRKRTIPYNAMRNLQLDDDGGLYLHYTLNKRHRTLSLPICLRNTRTGKTEELRPILREKLRQGIQELRTKKLPPADGQEGDSVNDD